MQTHRDGFYYIAFVYTGANTVYRRWYVQETCCCRNAERNILSV